jgi:hypothetical protein
MYNLNHYRFTHSKIRPFFSGCGRRIEDTLNSLINREIAVDDLPLINVLENDGALFSLNNRRLYVLKELRHRGLLRNNLVLVRTKEITAKEKKRYTTDRCSLTASIMQERSITSNLSSAESDYYEQDDDEN